MESFKFHNNTCNMNTMWYNSHKTLLELVAAELDCFDKVDMLVEKFLGKEIKFKKHKDKNLPKKPKTAFLFFCDEYRSVIKSENPECKMSDIMKLLGKKWQTGLSDTDKAKYFNQYNVAKATYVEVLDAYNSTN